MWGVKEILGELGKEPNSYKTGRCGRIQWGEVALIWRQRWKRRADDRMQKHEKQERMKVKSQQKGLNEAEAPLLDEENEEKPENKLAPGPSVFSACRPAVAFLRGIRAKERQKAGGASASAVDSGRCRGTKTAGRSQREPVLAGRQTWRCTYVRRNRTWFATGPALP